MNKNELLIGCDIGTSGTKAVVFDASGKAVSSATYEYGMSQPQNGWAEQDPLDWWQGACSAIKEAVENSGASPDAVRGIGLSGQMHGLVMLDESDRVIRPAIIWCDQRTAKECEEMTADLGLDTLMKITCSPALTGFTASKIKWVQNNEPENWARCAKLMLPKDYIRYRLTGEFATEVSDASGMQLLDVPNRRWSDTMLSYFGIKPSMVGKMYESQEATGRLTASAAALCGLNPGVVVAGGAGDQAASAVGNGIVKSGVASITMGTSGVVFVHSDSVKTDKEGRVHTFCHAVPGAWHVMGVTQGAGLSFKWFRDNFMGDAAATAAMFGAPLNKYLDDIAATVPAGARGLLYLPYLMGERSPHADPYCRGVFFGLSALHGRPEMLRAVLEGVVYSLLDCAEVIEEMGIPVSDIYLAGGGTNSKLWTQMMSDAFGKTMFKPNSSESGALGVALLAGVASGIYPDIAGASTDIVVKTASNKPDMKLHDIYKGYFDLYKNIYLSLKADFKTLAGLDR